MTFAEQKIEQSPPSAPFKGILLAGGTGSRLWPATLAISKQLLPLYDKPMVYYPLTTLLMAGCREILLISTPEDTPRFEKLFGDGADWGIRIQYAVQPEPKGIAQALLIAEDFLAGSPCALILGDNVFHGHGLDELLSKARASRSGATIFAYKVSDPQRYGVVEFNADGKAISIDEKPSEPKSHHAVTGLYFYDETASALAAGLTPSKRGELEITDLNSRYLDQGRLNVVTMDRGYAWLDTGTHESMIDGSQFIHVLEKRQGLKIGCPEETCWRNGWINDAQLAKLGAKLSGNDYGQYLLGLVEGKSC